MKKITKGVDFKLESPHSAAMENAFDYDSLNKAQHCGVSTALRRLKGCAASLKSKTFADSHWQEIRGRVSDAARFGSGETSIIPALALIGLAPTESLIAAGSNC